MIFDCACRGYYCQDEEKYELVSSRLAPGKTYSSLLSLAAKGKKGSRVRQNDRRLKDETTAASPADADSPTSDSERQDQTQNKEETKETSDSETQDQAQNEDETKEDSMEDVPQEPSSREVLRFVPDKDTECDFDLNPTNLLTAIHSKSWANVFLCLEEAPQKAKTWVSRRTNGKLDWRLLPLHATIVLGAPTTIVQAVLKAHPPAARSADDGGSLPFHLVSKLGSGQLIADIILQAYPQAYHVQDDKGRTPFELSGEPELDFNVNPSKIFVAIQEKAWNRVVSTLKRDPEQAKVWISRKDSDAKLCWRILPIHAAIISDAPLQIIQALLESHFEGIRAMDDQGVLPLHLACKLNRSSAIIACLLNAYPKASTAKDHKGRTPMDLL